MVGGRGGLVCFCLDLHTLSVPEPNLILLVKVLDETLTFIHFHNLGLLLEFQNIIDI